MAPLFMLCVVFILGFVLILPKFLRLILESTLIKKLLAFLELLALACPPLLGLCVFLSFDSWAFPNPFSLMEWVQTAM